MERMSIEEFEIFIKSSAVSRYSFHYSNQDESAIGKHVKMSVIFDGVEVMPDRNIIKFSSNSCCMLADNVQKVHVYYGNPLGLVIEIICMGDMRRKRSNRIVLSAT